MSFKKHTRLHAQRLLLLILTILELAMSVLVFVLGVSSMLVSLPNDSLYFLPVFVLFPLLCLILMISLLVFSKRNRQNPVIGRACVWIILLMVELPTIVWFISSLEIRTQTVEGAAIVLIILASILLDILLPLNLFQYTKAILREKAELDLQTININYT